MDVYCPRCGEPWDIDYVNHEMKVLERTDFRGGRGCDCCKSMEVCKRTEKCGDCAEYQMPPGKTYRMCAVKCFKRPFRAEASGAMMDILGDDLDGAAAMLEDFNL
jgi:hypothetical protein